MENLTKEPYYRNISMTVHAGEVLGVTGLLGDGRSEVFRTVFGDLNHYEGGIFIEGRPVEMKSITQALKHGIAYLPRNRKENGIIKDMDILDNGSIVTLRRISEHGFINRKKQKEQFEKQRRDLQIKMGALGDLIGSLSGGNQQKVVLAKWLTSDPKLLVLDNPTQGVDVGAKEEIYDIILQLAERGVAVVVLSNEAQEIIRVCSRSLVMYHGTVAAEVSGDSMNEANMMRLATGG